LDARDTTVRLVQTASDASVDPVVVHLDAGRPGRSEAVRDFHRLAWADALESKVVYRCQTLPQPDVPPMAAYPAFARNVAQELPRLAVARAPRLERASLQSKMEPQAEPPVLLADESASVQARSQEAHLGQVWQPLELREQLLSEPPVPVWSQEEPQPWESQV
jgi:hypothetical protein